MTAKLMTAIFLNAYTLGSAVYEGFTRNLGVAAIGLAVACGLSGTFLLWRSAEEQVPGE